MRTLQLVIALAMAARLAWVLWLHFTRREHDAPAGPSSHPNAREGLHEDDPCTPQS